MKPALTHYADKLPADALPLLGSLAHIGLFLARTCRRRFFRGLSGIFWYRPGVHKKGMRRLLNIFELDYVMRCDAVRDANRLRHMMPSVEREYVAKFFRALRRARTLREYYDLLDPFESDGEDTVASIFDGTAFCSGGLFSQLLSENVVPQSKEPAVKANVQKEQLPTYVKAARELRLGDVVMRRYGKRNFHEEILEAFQEAGWKAQILIPAFFSDPDRLRETIDQLNTSQKHRPMLIRFRLHGEDITWEWL